jgi:Proteasome subunit
MTVCIAAKAGNMVVAASDRMLTSGDVQIEPSAGTKIYPLSNSMFVMTAGDAALQAEIIGLVMREIAARIRTDPKDWWLVSEAADLYVGHYNLIRNKKAENAILSPLNLDGQSFLANQKGNVRCTRK